MNHLHLAVLMFFNVSFWGPVSDGNSELCQPEHSARTAWGEGVFRIHIFFWALWENIMFRNKRLERSANKTQITLLQIYVSTNMKHCLFVYVSPASSTGHRRSQSQAPGLRRMSSTALGINSFWYLMVLWCTVCKNLRTSRNHESISNLGEHQFFGFKVTFWTFNKKCKAKWKSSICAPSLQNLLPTPKRMRLQRRRRRNLWGFCLCLGRVNMVNWQLLALLDLSLRSKEAKKTRDHHAIHCSHKMNQNDRKYLKISENDLLLGASWNTANKTNTVIHTWTSWRSCWKMLISVGITSFTASCSSPVLWRMMNECVSERSMAQGSNPMALPSPRSLRWISGLSPCITGNMLRESSKARCNEEQNTTSKPTSGTDIRNQWHSMTNDREQRKYLTI